jgi:hypothetical protein
VVVAIEPRRRTERRVGKAGDDQRLLPDCRREAAAGIAFVEHVPDRW